jgi:hypothetical protein
VAALFSSGEWQGHPMADVGLNQKCERMRSLLQEYRSLLDEAARREIERTDWLLHQFRFVISKAALCLRDEPVFGLNEPTERASQLIRLSEEAKDAVTTLSALRHHQESGLDIRRVSDKLRVLEELSNEYVETLAAIDELPSIR